MDTPIKHIQISVRGLVQGVGFRPFVYRIAIQNNISGTVENRNDGVVIQASSSEKNCNHFLEALRKEAPPASHIELIDVKEFIPKEVFSDFRIVKSTNVSNSVTEVSPDIAVCDDCLKDMSMQENRIDYSFINCTNCGPRFTIIQDLPYDRDKTSMQPFVMCEKCHAEYTNILDRRFHAQPVACNDCGPHYTLHTKENQIHDIQQILKKTATLLESGNIVAIKGLGGFFLACDASNETACVNLREFKNREGKPFAILFRDIEIAKKFVRINDKEEKQLTSWRRPIVLLNQHTPLAPAVNNGLNKIGVMLPYMPFHFQLFQHTSLPALVLTSGNLSEEPILIDNDSALGLFSKNIDAVITYNRDIVNRCDDSVVSVIHDKTRMMRRSRGYVPNPIRLKNDVEGILATGAELKNTFCIGKGNMALLSQHIGDLKNTETYDFYCETIEKFSRLFRFTPSLIACDLHPDYLSSRYAAERNMPLVKVQHHHAHIASVMAEHKLDTPVIGVSFDGTGLGDDNAIWGGEIFVCDYKSYERKSHIEYVSLPGGDGAASEPWRMALSWLHAAYGEKLFELPIPLFSLIEKSKTDLIYQAIQKKINSPNTSSAGRLFDAVSALSGVCLRHSYEAEGPMLLEALDEKNCEAHYTFDFSSSEIIFKPMIREIVDDIIQKIPLPLISAKFHNTVAGSVVAKCIQLKKETGLNSVALSGGVFQNALLLERTEVLLEKNNFFVFSNEQIPSNDGGIALGQLMVGSHQI